MRATIIVAALLSASAVLAVAGSASADPRTHDGFQFRGAVGPGYLSTSTSAAGESLTIKGVSGSGDFYFGGTPVTGLVIGGMFNGTTAFGPSVTLNGQTLQGVGSGNSSTTLTLFTIGPYVNYYLDPKEGLYFLAMIGFGAESYTQSGQSGNSPSGFAGALGAGYDFWVGDQWSLGVLGRFTYGSLTYNSVTYSTIQPAVMFSFTYQ